MWNNNHAEIYDYNQISQCKCKYRPRLISGKREEPGKRGEEPGKRGEEPGKRGEELGKRGEELGKRGEEPSKRHEEKGKWYMRYKKDVELGKRYENVLSFGPIFFIIVGITSLGYLSVCLLI